MTSLDNLLMFPVDRLLKNELRGGKGDLKRPFDKSMKDYQDKYKDIENRKNKQAKEAGKRLHNFIMSCNNDIIMYVLNNLFTTTVTTGNILRNWAFIKLLCLIYIHFIGLHRGPLKAGEIADEIEKERKYLQLTTTDYLLRINEIRTKKGIDLLQHLMNYYQDQKK